MVHKLPLVFTPQPEGGYTVTSPILPELITEGDTLDDAYANVADALAAVKEIYAEQSRELPPGVVELAQLTGTLPRNNLLPGVTPGSYVLFGALVEVA